MTTRMSSMERVLASLAGKEPDQIPLFFLFTIYGAKETGTEIESYFKDVDLVVSSQLKMQEKYASDCFYTFQYASAEYEAFGGSTIYYPEAPPNAGRPIFASSEAIMKMKTPKIDESEGLCRILEVTRRLKAEVGDRIPIIGVVMAPFSLPVMQMGFENYLKLIIEGGEAFEHLMKINQEFCVNWANRQLEAGATAICYFNPVASGEMIERSLYVKRAFDVDCKTIEQIQGPTATHFASARTIPTLDLIEKTGTNIVVVSARESIADIKTGSTLTVMGNLDGILLRTSSEAEIREQVGLILDQGTGGRVILSDNHGEIPWQIPESALLTIADEVNKR